jgi:hypothetical protein
MPDNIHAYGNLPIKQMRACPENENFPDEFPPKKIVECVFVYISKGIQGESGSYYVLLEDGTIWLWSPVLTGTDFDLLLLSVGYIGFLLGGFTGVFLICVYLLSERKRSKAHSGGRVQG